MYGEQGWQAQPPGPVGPGGPGGPMQPGPGMGPPGGGGKTHVVWTALLAGVFAVLLVVSLVADMPSKSFEELAGDVPGLSGDDLTLDGLEDGGDLGGADGLDGLDGLDDLEDLEGLEDSGGAGDIGGSGGGDAGGSGSDASGGSGGGDSGGVEPAPDPVGDAFRDVQQGDCLQVWDTGGEWSANQPYEVNCSSSDAVMWVSAVSDSALDCPTGAGQWYWEYTHTDYSRTVICMTRQFQEGYCFMAKQEGSGSNAKIVDGNLMSLIDCDSATVPSPYNQILHITGVYSAPASPDSTDCARVQGDQTYYWYWVVDDGDTLLCTMVYGS
ncbi:LppU/SCO3897 family protein [Streptomyces aidingensis]|uniref:Uncharacterized protein n=1 Tax=Streptomyces aidingensis TaxID=910347 RepID=A0A1I1QG34_9ACTN|nr:hypothetical protein [Streptomyces aidingensis]SFD21036.1 hypothetical protein SAMN05421773_11188 [Streptomyces aidingensis]